MNSDPTAVTALVVSIFSLAVAGIAAVTGIVALAWQVRTRRRGAHHVIVRFVGGRVVPTLPVLVEVLNVGASSVELKRWGIDVSAGKRVSRASLPAVAEAGNDIDGAPEGNESVYWVFGESDGHVVMPYVLEPGRSVTLAQRVDVKTVSERLASRGRAAVATAEVRLGTGETVKSKATSVGAHQGKLVRRDADKGEE